MERVRTYEISQEARDCVLAPEELWSVIRNAGGWQAWTGETNIGGEKQVGVLHRNTNLSNYPDQIPEFIKKAPNYREDAMISTFVGDCEESGAALNWHVDPYEVYAFNVEGNTIWEYFDLDTGKVEAVELGEMDQAIYMPCGITHRVRIMSETRTSISVVLPGTLNGLRVQQDRR